MRNRLFFSMLAIVLAVVGFTVPLQAQTQPTITTLSAAMTAATTRMTVTSNSGFTASSGTQQYIAYVDQEAMLITAVSGTTFVTVTRGVGPSIQTAHASGAHVITGARGSVSAGSVTGGPFVDQTPIGSCTRGAIPSLPLINVRKGEWANCMGGVWVTQTPLDSIIQPALQKVCTVPIGSVAYGSFGTSATTSTTGQLTANVFVPNTFIATGFTNLNGSAVDGASKKIVMLYTSDGLLIGNSATAGTTASGNDSFQAIPFTATKVVTGPAYYFVGLQDDTADVNGVRTIAASTFNGVLASSITSVFGTVASSITVPTTFTADVGPIGCLY